MFQVQADIAGRVAQALDVALGAGVQQQLAEKPTQNLAAYDAYLKGVEAYSAGRRSGHAAPGARLFRAGGRARHRRSPSPGRGCRKSASLLNSVATPSPAVAARSRLAAERALALAPDRPEGHVALGDYYRRIGPTTPAPSRSTPGPATGARRTRTCSAARGLAEQALGRWDSALVHLQQAQTLDPRSATIASRACDHALSTCGDIPRRGEAADRALALAAR